MRLRLFWLAIAALYVAPVTAGLYGAGWLAVAGFAVLFALFNLAMERIPPQPLLALASLAVVAGLAIVLVSAGWGLRALTGFATTLPAWPWLALGLGATALARLVWPPRLTREMGALIDDATEQLETMAEELGRLDSEVPSTTLDDEAADRMNAALDALPPDAGPEPVAAVVLPLTDQASPGALFDAALARARNTPCPRDHAALHWAAVNDDAIDLCTGHRQLALAWAQFVEADDHPALDRFAGATIRIIHDDPHAWRDMPESGEIIRVALAIEPANPALGEELAGLGKAMIALERSADV
ncbi:hypothetical protein [Oceanicola sp. 502str15]|uniref:hypothetical protein n=1 Tax=Oceanicola sp. 502str15 TaxID=2696061 RepID=UPI002095BB15|nr:hypothetical protein [Oceanicola sp. 502str15]MCO6385095.1 hypothetical protein [Oceanicola sp. 502str15]